MNPPVKEYSYSRPLRVDQAIHELNAIRKRHPNKPVQVYFFNIGGGMEVTYQATGTRITRLITGLMGEKGKSFFVDHPIPARKRVLVKDWLGLLEDALY